MYIFMCVALFFVACNAQDESLTEDSADLCITRNGYTKVPGSCDAYFECMDYQSSRKLCPDGLNFNSKAKWPMYPCTYPSDAPCLDPDVSQPAKPTADCPRLYGFFQSPKATANDCSQYRLCSEGYAYDMYCPFGLAFDTVKARCDWPDLVPGCNAEDFLGFTCPAPEYDLKGNPLISNYRYEDNCYMFYSCQSGHARLLSCDPGFAFDSALGRCTYADLVQCVIDSNDDEAPSAVENE